MSIAVPVPINYPRTIRLALAAFRAERPASSFDEAWEAVKAAHPYPVRSQRGRKDDLDYVEFLRVHFGAAYNRDGSAQGRWGSPEPEASSAVKPLRRDGPPASRPPLVHCMWAEGCALPPTHGRFGAFCEDHAGVLSRIVVPAHEGFNPWGEDEVEAVA